MDLKPLFPTNDFVFKKVFGENVAEEEEDFMCSSSDLSFDEVNRIAAGLKR